VASPTLLIIDGDKDLSRLCAEVLSSSFEIETCDNGQKALNRLTAYRPDLVILDLNLPGVSGETVLKQLRSDGKFNKTKVVILSADLAGADEHTLQKADLVLYKPISPYDLKQMCLLLSYDQ
jgi:CheY-like chemotaxis protein